MHYYSFSKYTSEGGVWTYHKRTERQWFCKSVLFLAIINNSLGSSFWRVVFDVARSGSQMQNRFYKTGHFGKSILKPVFFVVNVRLVLYGQAIEAHES